MKSAIAKLLAVSGMLLALGMSSGPEGSSEAQPAGAEIFTGSAATCQPLGHRCVGLTDCCIGRCINHLCLKL